MAGVRARGSSTRPALVDPMVDPLLEAKLNRPPTRADWVERARLLDLFDSVVQRATVLVAAPAGFGKTTLVAQWLTSRGGPRVAAWISLDSGDNVSVRLWTHVAMALDRAGCDLGFEVATFMAAHGREMTTKVLPRLLGAMGAAAGEVVVVLDDFHLVDDAACHDQVEFFFEHLPQNAHLVITTRADPGLRLARHRAAGHLAEIRSADLAFTVEETGLLLKREDVYLPEGLVSDLVRRTEGWPAGLYLVALSALGRSDPKEFVREVSEGNRFIGDYLTEEVLARHPAEVREFIRTISILDRFSAPLCDYLTGTTNSVAILHELERTNLFLVPLDERRTWFRFHHLFASVARSELEYEHAALVPALHARAAKWFAQHGHIDEAVRHSLASGNTSEAALLIQANWLSYIDAGRTEAVSGWLDELGAEAVAADPAARVTAAWMAAMAGDREGLERLVADLEQVKDYGPLPDGTRCVESAVGMIQGVFGYGGPVEMTVGSQRAVELETDARSPYYAIAHTARGHAAYVAGDLDLATDMFAKGLHNESAPAVLRVLSLSGLSLVAAERGEQKFSAELAQQAMDLLEAAGLRTMPQATMGFTAMAQAHAAAGRLDEAAASVEEGLGLRRKNPAQGPWGVLHHLLVAARVATQRGEVSKARLLVLEISDRMDHYPQGMEAMRSRLAAIEEQLRMPVIEAEPDVLTDRELEVLRFLLGSLSLNEIAGELYISPNTVKTHAKAVYRKLGASSRTEAVRIARSRLLV
jgi:LuxR family maltose regulon positive regulatory protein